MSIKSKQEQQWRKDKIRELTIKGNTQREIANELMISVTLVNRYLRGLRQEAKQNIVHYIDEYLPAEFQYCLDSLNMIVKEMWTVKPEDNRELVQVRTLIKECTAMRIDLLSNATVVQRAVQFVEKHKGLINENNKVVIDDTLRPIENPG